MQCSTLPSAVKLLALLTGALSLELMIIFIILKLDGRTAVHHWSWMLLIVIPLATTAACALIWLTVHYVSTLAENQQDATKVDKKEYLRNRSYVNVLAVDTYSETSVFRDALLVFCYLALLSYGVVAYTTPCTSCNTPYKILSIAVTLCYGIRIFLLGYTCTLKYAYFKVVTKEVFAYQSGFDQVGESRMFNDVLPDLGWPKDDEDGGCGSRGWWWWVTRIDFGIFLMTVLFAVVGTLWIVSNECALKCNRLFHYCQYLLLGMYVVEGLYIVTALLLRYYKRSSGVESLQNLFNYLIQQDRDAINKQKALDDKAAAVVTDTN